MKSKTLSLAMVALLAAGGAWLVRSAWHTPARQTTRMEAGTNEPPGPHPGRSGGAAWSGGAETDPAPGPDLRPEDGQNSLPPARLAPPEPLRRFTDFTPEQRVQFARQGHGPGG